MKREIPQPEKIIEELVDKAVEQIDRLAVTGFEDALNELLVYHRFLLEAYETTSSDGVSFSYAQVGGFFQAPHQQWIHEYRRLFERGANQLAVEPDFIKTLARIPLRLLPAQGLPSPAVVESLLDLSLYLVHRLEAWVQRHTKLLAPAKGGEPLTGSLPGPDARAYDDVVLGLVGAWESALQLASSIYGWRDAEGASDEERWRRLQASWPFLARHLRNAAYHLATAAWSDDAIGAEHYRDALVRWLDTSLLRDRDILPMATRASPDEISLEWAVVVAVDGLDTDGPFRPAPSPQSLFTRMVRRAHDDVILVTAAVLLQWRMDAEGDAHSRVVSIAEDLLVRRTNSSGSHHLINRPERGGFRSWFMRILRLLLVGERKKKGSYGDYLDGLITAVDMMREPRVVHGRVYSPTTMHSRFDLRLSLVAILLAEITKLDPLLREKDIDYLRNAVDATSEAIDELVRLRDIMGKSESVLSGIVGELVPDANFADAATALKEAFDTVLLALEGRQAASIAALPIDEAKLSALASAIRDRAAKFPAHIPYFSGFRIEFKEDPLAVQEDKFTFLNVSRGQFTKPEMDQVSMDPDYYSESMAAHLAAKVWHGFLQRPREMIEVQASEPASLWIALTKIAAQVGEMPTIVVSESDQGALLDWLDDEPVADGIVIERKAISDRGNYCATINGIDAYWASGSGPTLLFSANSLASVEYLLRSDDQSPFEVRLEEGKDASATQLVVRFAQQPRWRDSPIFELGRDVADRLPSEDQ